MRIYAQDLLRITKYRRRRQELEINDVVLIADKMCKGSKSLALGQIVDKKSNRTFLVKYISRESKLDEKTFEIKRVAVKKIFERSAQSLIFVCKPHERDEIVVDPYIYPDENIDQMEIENIESGEDLVDDSETNSTSKLKVKFAKNQDIEEIEDI